MTTQSSSKSEAKSQGKERGIAPFIDEFDRLAEELFAGVSPLRAMPRLRDRLRSGVWAPAVDVVQRNGDLIVRADLPGVERQDIQVSLENSILQISGRRQEEKEITEKDYYRSERAYGEFFRAIRMPEGVRAESVSASFKDGVLEVVVPKGAKPESKATTIPVK